MHHLLLNTFFCIFYFFKTSTGPKLVNSSVFVHENITDVYLIFSFDYFIVSLMNKIYIFLIKNNNKNLTDPKQ